MGNSSTKAKRKYNAEHYGSIHVYLEKSKVDKFKAYAKEIGMSQSAIIECFLDYEYMGSLISGSKLRKSIEDDREEKRRERRERDRKRAENFKKIGRYDGKKT